MIHLSTSVYTNWNEVISRLGMNIEVYAGNITLTYSQNVLTYTCGNPHQSLASMSRS